MLTIKLQSLSKRIIKIFTAVLYLIAHHKRKLSVLLLIGISIISVAVLVYSSRKEKNDFVIAIDEKDTQENLQKRIEGQVYQLADRALDQGISDTVIYIYAVGTDNNYSSIEASLNAAARIGSTNKVKVLVFYDPPTSKTTYETTKMFLLQRNNGTIVEQEVIADLGVVDSGDAQILYDFISFGMKNFPARKNILFIDGVGNGAEGIVYDQSNNSFLTGAELEQAVSGVFYSGGVVFDSVIINTSFVADIALLTSLARFTKYIVAPHEAVSPDALDYSLLLNSQNTSSFISSSDITTVLLRDIAKNNCSSWKSYDTRKLINVANGLESLATKILRDESKTLLNSLLETLNNSHPRKTLSAYKMDYYSLTEVLDYLLLYGDQSLSIAAKRISQDLSNSIKNPYCEGAPDALISFPRTTQTQLSGYLSRTPYTVLPSFKELIRLSLPITDIRQPIPEVITTEGDGFIAKYSNNASFCGQAITLDSRVYVTSIQSIVNYNEKSFSCPSIQKTYRIQGEFLPLLKIGNDRFMQRVIFSLNGKPAEGNLYITKDGQKTLIATRISSTENVFNVNDSENITVMPIYESLDRDGQKGYFFSNWWQISRIGIEESPNLLKPYIASTFEKENQIKIRVYDTDTQFSVTNLNHSYNLFALYSDFNNITSPRDYSLDVTQPLPVAYTADFSTVESTQSSYSKQGYQYYEYIFAERINKDPKKKTITPFNTNFGEDYVYYKGELLPDSDNITFWTQWLQ